MRIAILCNCLESGRDGVGDGVRRLATELDALGVQTLLIALNDTFVESLEEAGVIRLPASMKWSDRSNLLKKHIKAFRPDFIRLDFVAFGMNKKGLVSGLVSALKPLAKHALWVIYFHEIWLGFKPSLPLKHKVLGRLQRYWIEQLVGSVSPVKSWTSNLIYQRALSRAGIHCELLPLVNPIPVTSGLLATDELPLIKRQNMRRTETGRLENWILAPFQVPANWKPTRIVALLKEVYKQRSQKAVVLAVGGQGAGIETWQMMIDDNPDLAEWVVLGRQPEAAISSLASHCEYGLALSPMSLLGKSGSCAMLVEHGMKVIACHDSKESNEQFSFEALNPYGESVRYLDTVNIEAFVSTMSDWDVPEGTGTWSRSVAERFIEQLHQLLSKR